MRSLILVILFIICATTNGLSCISVRERPEWTLDNFNDEVFLKYLTNLTTSEVQNGSLCRVGLNVDYEFQSFIISFREHLEHSKLDDQQVEFSTTVDCDDTEDVIIRNYLGYGCSENGCEKEFIINHIGWLRTAVYPELQTHIIPLVVDHSKKPGKYFNIIIGNMNMFGILLS
jgi:hypothetical protein